MTTRGEGDVASRSTHSLPNWPATATEPQTHMHGLLPPLCPHTDTHARMAEMMAGYDGGKGAVMKGGGSMVCTGCKKGGGVLCRHARKGGGQGAVMPCCGGVASGCSDALLRGGGIRVQ